MSKIRSLDAMVRLTQPRLVAAAGQLAARDADLGRILRAYGPPPMWARRAGFETLVRIILEQQVSLASAAAMHKRLLARIAPFTPRGFLQADEGHLKTLGVTRQKTAYLIRLAEALEDGTLDLKRVARADDRAAAAMLTSVKGIGPWTAQIYLLMALRRPDIWPTGDIALARAVRATKRLRKSPSPARLCRIAEAWRPYRSVAARMLWQSYLAERADRRRA
jgi:DNA-3-methyladenine glycosylase II